MWDKFLDIIAFSIMGLAFMVLGVLVFGSIGGTMSEFLYGEEICRVATPS